MARVLNGRIIFNEIPEDFPDPRKSFIYDTTEKIDLDKVAIGGGVLLKTLYVSVDPYMRSRMRDPAKESYLPAYIIGQPISGFGIGKVIRSENPQYRPGNHVSGVFEYQHYVIYHDKPPESKLRVLDESLGLPWSAYLGVLGMPGKTAYSAWKEFSSAKKGETVFVSTGAGPVGSFVIQLAKRDGCRIIGSAGSDEKVQFMKEIGTDVPFNYKTTNTRDVLLKEGGIDIYWDNVGGQILDNALETARLNGRFIECGMITGYNTGFKEPLPHIMQIVANSLTLYGFIVFRIEGKYEDEFYEIFPKLVKSKEIKYKEEITFGLEKVGEVLLNVQKGLNKAKAVIQVADD